MPEAWSGLLRKLLAARPEERYESYTGLRRALHDLRAKPQVAAGRFPRAFAFATDVFVAGTLFGLTSVPAVLVQLFELEGSLSIVQFAATLISPLGLVAYGLLEVLAPKTPGRYLFQLRVVDDHGLRPRRGRRILRHFLRMAFLWTGVISSFTDPITEWIAFPAVLASSIFVLVDQGMVLFGPAGMSLHDLICKTRVVLDQTTDLDDER